MRQLKVRQAATAGLLMSFILAAAISGQSADPLPTFAYILSVGLVMTLLATGIAVAINSQSPRPPDAG
jgi:biotin transporter BioY